ncbi:hypothetical protein B296_00001217 [Ensete ventricosum]|uniref:Uncharacterized protein n=1 Tax=Ensete ventricosum TaxID=4639 RepID=A0A427B5L8_ENSVE|nr:hypothetical protein B296_00001217 [Ensete ventricosum]
MGIVGLPAGGKTASLLVWRTGREGGREVVTLHMANNFTVAVGRKAALSKDLSDDRSWRRAQLTPRCEEGRREGKEEGERKREDHAHHHHHHWVALRQSTERERSHLHISRPRPVPIHAGFFVFWQLLPLFLHPAVAFGSRPSHLALVNDEGIHKNYKTDSRGKAIIPALAILT